MDHRTIGECVLAVQCKYQGMQVYSSGGLVAEVRTIWRFFGQASGPRYRNHLMFPAVKVALLYVTDWPGISINSAIRHSPWPFAQSGFVVGTKPAAGCSGCPFVQMNTCGIRIHEFSV